MVIIGAAVLLPTIIDPNDYKPEIEAAAYRYIGKKLILEGSLEITIFPWLGVTTGKVLVINPSSIEQPALASIDEGHLKVKLLPLLGKKVELSQIVLKNPIVHLITDQQGNKNWHNKVSTTARPAQTTESNDDTRKVTSQSVFLQELTIAGVSIENGRIIWIDEQKQQQTEINQLNCDVGTLAHEQSVPINLSMQFKREQNQSGQFKAKGLLVFTKNLDHFSLSDLEINTIVEKPSVNNKITVTARSTNIELDWQQQQFKISELSVTSGDMALSANLDGRKIKDNPEIQGTVTLRKFNPREFLTYLGKPVPATQDNSSLTQLSGSFNLLANKNSAQFNEFQAKLDDSNITGYWHVNDFKQPAFKFDINIDTINLDRYLLSKPAAQEQPKSPEKLAAVPGTKTPDNPQPKPTAPVHNAQNKSEPGLFPIELLRKMNATGKLSISKITSKELSLQDLTINLDAKNGVLKTNHKINKLYQGNYSGNLYLDVKKQTPDIALNEKFARIQAAPLLQALYGKARLSGTLTGNTSLSSRGNTTQALKARLNGKAHISLKNGTIYGFNLQEIVKKTKARLKKSIHRNSNIPIILSSQLAPPSKTV